MKMMKLHCPHCGARLEVDNGLDTFFCMHCGHKIVLDQQSKEIIRAKVMVKHMEHQERMADKRHEQERFKIAAENRKERKSWLTLIALWIGLMLGIGAIVLIGSLGAARQEAQLQGIVTEIMTDIRNGQYAEAYIKASSLYWDASWSDEGKEKWDATRKTVIRQIQEAEREATGVVTYEAEEGNWLSDLLN